MNGQKSKHGKRLLDALLVLHRRAKIAYLIGKSTEWVRNNLVQHELQMMMKTYDSQDDGDDNVNEYRHCKYDHDNHMVCMVRMVIKIATMKIRMMNMNTRKTGTKIGVLILKDDVHDNLLNRKQ